MNFSFWPFLWFGLPGPGATPDQRDKPSQTRSFFFFVFSDFVFLEFMGSAEVLQKTAGNRRTLQKFVCPI